MTAVRNNKAGRVPKIVNGPNSMMQYGVAIVFLPCWYKWLELRLRGPNTT